MLKNIFYHALNEDVRNELAKIEEPETLDELICVADHLDYKLQTRVRPSPVQSSSILSGSAQFSPVQPSSVQSSPVQSSSVQSSTALYSPV